MSLYFNGARESRSLVLWYSQLLLVTVFWSSPTFNEFGANKKWDWKPWVYILSGELSCVILTSFRWIWSQKNFCWRVKLSLTSFCWIWSHRIGIECYATSLYFIRLLDEAKKWDWKLRYEKKIVYYVQYVILRKYFSLMHEFFFVKSILRTVLELRNSSRWDDDV